MTMPPLSLSDGLRLVGLSYPQLWARYVAIGGSGTVDDLKGRVDNDRCPDDHDHNVIAQVLNDIFIEQGRDHPVTYRHLYTRDDHRHV